MKKISQQSIDDVREKSVDQLLDIVENRLGTASKKSGSNYSFVCPFHNDKSPSFTVNTTKGIGKCFACDATVHSGLDFIIKHDRLDFLDAVKVTADMTGVQLQYDEDGQNSSAEHAEQKKLAVSLFKALKDAEQGFSYGVMEQGTAISYLQGKRKFTEETIKEFGFGYARGAYASKVLSKRYDVDTLIIAGLIGKNDERNETYEFFRNRIMLPVHNEQGATIAFTARVLEDIKPKYLNSPASPIFDKSSTLFNLHRAGEHIRKDGLAIVVEGSFDVVSLHQGGEKRSVAGLGTAFTEKHLKRLFKYADEVVFCQDGDEAGAKAAARSVETFLSHAPDSKTASFITIPQTLGKDPDDVMTNHGIVAWNKCVDSRITLSEKIAQLCVDAAKPHGIRKVEGKISAAIYAKRIIALCGNAPLRQTALKSYLTETLGLPLANEEASNTRGQVATPEPVENGAKSGIAASAPMEQSTPVEQRHAAAANPKLSEPQAAPIAKASPSANQQTAVPTEKANSELARSLHELLEIVPTERKARAINPRLAELNRAICDEIEKLKSTGMKSPLLFLPVAEASKQVGVQTDGIKIIVATMIDKQIFISARSESAIKNVEFNLNAISRYQSEAMVDSVRGALTVGLHVLKNAPKSLTNAGYIIGAEISRSLLSRAAKGDPSEFSIWPIKVTGSAAMMSGRVIDGEVIYNIRTATINELSDEHKKANLVVRNANGILDSAQYYVEDALNGKEMLLIGKNERESLDRALKTTVKHVAQPVNNTDYMALNP